MSRETVPCLICGRPTMFTGTRLCDPCWNGCLGVEIIHSQTTGEIQKMAAALLDRLDALRFPGDG